MLRNTGNTDAVIIEYGFLDSSKDDVSQIKNNWQQYAEASVKAIAEYLGLPYDNIQEDSEYIVKPGDTLWSIAKKFNTTVNDIKAINNLTSNLLTIGQKLFINPSTTNEYIVQAGDTLYSIAQKYNLTVDELKELNNLSSNLLQIGDKLKVNNNVNNQIYTVKPGDTLYSIAMRYNTTVNQIKNKNNLNNNLLNIGQQLIIP